MLCSLHCKQALLVLKIRGLDNPMARMGTAEAWGKQSESQQRAALGEVLEMTCHTVQSDPVPTYFRGDREFNAMNGEHVLQAPAFLILSCFIPAAWTRSTHHLVVSLTLSLFPQPSQSSSTS